MADLSKIRVADCELSVRTTNLLTRHFWGDVTLKDVDEASDLPKLLGRKGFKELCEVIENAKAWVDPAPPRPDAAIASLEHALQMEDGEYVEFGHLREVLEWINSH